MIAALNLAVDVSARTGTTEHRLRQMFSSPAGMPLSEYVQVRRLSHDCAAASLSGRMIASVRGTRRRPGAGPGSVPDRRAAPFGLAGRLGCDGYQLVPVAAVEVAPRRRNRRHARLRYRYRYRCRCRHARALPSRRRSVARTCSVAASTEQHPTPEPPRPRSGRLWFTRAGADVPHRPGLFCEVSAFILRRLLGWVELAGIEPASCGAVPGLLRVQFVLSLFSAPALPRTGRRRAQSGKSPGRPS